MAKQKSGGFSVVNPAESVSFRQQIKQGIAGFATGFAPLSVVALFAVLICFSAYVFPMILPLVLSGFLGLSVIFLLFRSARRWAFAFFLVVMVAFSCEYAVLRIHWLQAFDRQTVPITFTVCEDPVRTENSRRVTATATADGIDGTFKISLWYQHQDLTVGVRYRGTVWLKSVEKTDYRTSSYANGIYLTGTLQSPVTKVGENRFLMTAGGIRKYVRKTLSERLSKDTAAMLCAVTIGDRNGLSDSFENAVRAAGVSHVLVVSGMHLAIALKGFEKLLRMITHNRFLQTFIGVVGVLFFVVVCGFTMSIIRAGFTFLILALAPLFKRDGDAVSALSATVLLVAIFSPFAILNLSYQLSVASTFGILIIQPYYSRKIVEHLPRKGKKWLNRFLSPLVGSLAATVMTFPIVAIRFGAVSGISPLTNMLISYPVTVALTTVLAALVLTAVPWIRLLSIPLFFVTGILTRYINRVIGWCGKEEFLFSIPAWAQILTFLPALAVLLTILACNQRNYLLKLKCYREDGGDRHGDSVGRRNS